MSTLAHIMFHAYNLLAGRRKAASADIQIYSQVENQHFAPSGKNYELDRKMVDTFEDG